MAHDPIALDRSGAAHRDRAEKQPARPGRKRDPARDDVILESALAILADHGFDGMTIDLVAEHAGMARATIYRRWATKADLVFDAVSHLSEVDADQANLPDTGSLRGDMVARIRPFDDEQHRIRIQAVIGLLLAARVDQRLAAAAQRSAVAPWIEVNRILIQRAVDRGEYAPSSDISILSEVIPMLCVSRAAQRLPIDREFAIALIDNVLLPALRGGSNSQGDDSPSAAAASSS